VAKDKTFSATFKGRREATGVLRGRDVRAKLLTRNIDPEVRTILEQIAEINHINMLAIAELATMQDKIIDLVQGFSNIAGNMKDRTDAMARAMGETAEGAAEDAEDTQH
jgi:hypothetical protein